MTASDGSTELECKSKRSVAENESESVELRVPLEDMQTQFAELQSKLSEARAAALKTGRISTNVLSELQALLSKQLD